MTTTIEIVGKYEAIIISVAILSMTGAVVMHAISEATYSALLGAFMGYTFARIFNHVQHKE